MKEFWNTVQFVFTAVGGWLGYFLGGCDGLIYALLAFVVIDYLTGVMCAVSDRKLSSAVGFRGICRKVLIFLLVGIANILDVQVIGTGSVLRTAVVFFYLSNEGVSLLENASHLGLPVPEKIKEVLEQLHDRSDKEFITAVAGYVDKYASAYGILVRSSVIAQAILESGWGKSTLAAKYHNYFGLKCGTKWKGGSVNLSTKEEYTPGTLTSIRDNFRTYSSMEEGVKGYFEFIQLSRYQNLKGITDPRKYLETIREDGFATSSDYVKNCMALVEQYELKKYDNAKERETMAKTAAILIAQAKAWVGCREADGSHKKIIDTYNAHRPLARNYSVKYTDAWCATFVSACAIKTGMTDIIQTECGCGQMIALFQKLGEWDENDARVPRPGDIVFYDWDDSGKGDNTGWPDHVGIVEKVSGSTITVIEGNKGNAVGRRTLQVNGKYIRGYGVPKYNSGSSQNTSSGNAGVSSSSGGINKTPKWVGKVTASSLNVRKWAGKEYGRIKSYPYLYRGNLVDVCDTVKAADGKAWYYIRIAGKYYGFVSSDYIVKA